MATHPAQAVTYSQLQAMAQQAMAPAIGEGEARWAARMIMEGATGRSRADLLARGAERPLTATVQTVMQAAARVAAGEPVQYVLGFEEFVGLRIGVGPGVLIPRRETEEMCREIISREQGRKDLRVADLYSGSGCIALALARHLPFARVTAVELSSEAVSRLKANALALKADVTIEQADATLWRPSTESLDIVVANPPYVLESERAGMLPVVLLHEPHEALFVPDADPLLHYRHIARAAAEGLVAGGHLYLEINPLEAGPLTEMLRQAGFADAEPQRDSSGRLRFIFASKTLS